MRDVRSCEMREDPRSESEGLEWRLFAVAELQQVLIVCPMINASCACVFMAQLSSMALCTQSGTWPLALALRWWSAG